MTEEKEKSLEHVKIQPGTPNKLQDLVGYTGRQSQSQSIEVSLDKHVLFLDSSGSMYSKVGERTKWEHLLAALEANYSDKPSTKCISYSGTAVVTNVLNPEMIGGMTRLNTGFMLAEDVYNIAGISSIVVISDGMDDYELSAAETAKKWADSGIKGDFIYIGREGDRGERFMREMAEIMNGEQITVHDKCETEIKLLTSAIKGFLPSGDRTINL